MNVSFEASATSSRPARASRYQFEIPDYQRPYAWTTEQAGELFDDLISAMQDARVSGATKRRRGRFHSVLKQIQQARLQGFVDAAAGDVVDDCLFELIAHWLCSELAWMT